MNKLLYISLPIFIFLLGGERINSTALVFGKGTPAVKESSTYDVLTDQDIIFGNGLSHKSVNSKKAVEIPLKLDVYYPDNELKNRPVFLFVHGGGFSGGEKQQSHIVRWANYYTSRGWVFISIDYRLKKNKGTVPKEWLDYSVNVPVNRRGQFLAIYPAQRDAKAALRWIIANAEKYYINTNYITVGGCSAGAITAISMGVSNSNDFKDEIDISQDFSLSSTNLNKNFKIRTIVDLWGSKVALDLYEKIYRKTYNYQNAPPIFIAHGTNDITVPLKNAEELRIIYEINQIPFAYYPLQGLGHGPWKAKVNDTSLEKLAFDFIVEQQKLTVL